MGNGAYLVHSSDLNACIREWCFKVFRNFSSWCSVIIVIIIITIIWVVCVIYIEREKGIKVVKHDLWAMTTNHWQMIEIEIGVLLC